MSPNVAVFGLGSMGYGIARSCLRANMTVYGYDVVDATVTRFVEDGGATGAFSDVASELDAVIVAVLNASQMESVIFGENGALEQVSAGSVVIGCATVAPDFAKEVERRCGEKGVHYLDAPISGGSVKASLGQLSIMASGTSAAFEAAEPVLSATAETVFRLGDAAGAGSAMKAVNQLLAGVHIATMAEALTFGMTQGIPPETFVDVITKCAGSSWMLENRAPHIVAGDYTPHSQVNIWPKDLGIVLEAAQATGFDAPIAETALAQYRRAVEMGLGMEDDAAVAKVYAQSAGLTLPEKQP